MSLADRYARVIIGHGRLVIAVMLVATALVGAGAGQVDPGLSIAGFESNAPEAAALEYLQSNFSTEGENTTLLQVVVRGEDVLSKSSLLESLRFQRAVRESPEINATLAARQPTVGLANLVAIAAMENGGDGGPGSPSLSAQIAHLEGMSPAAVESTLAALLDPERNVGGVADPYAFLPVDHPPRETTASARLLFVFQDTSGGTTLSPAAVDAQLALADLAATSFPDTESFVFGPGLVEERSTQATGESFALISPIALLLLLLVLGLAYRDLGDVVLGLLGVALVLLWMAGVMGWAGIGVTQILIAVPFLLIGLSIDYALHVVMRYREASTADEDRSVREAMRRGLAGVVLAIGAATVTTAIGFASNAVSPIQSIREFGLISAAGIVSAFLVFGVLLPPLKVEIDRLRRRFGRGPQLRPFGRRGLPGRALAAGARVGRRLPVVVLTLALILSAGGAVAATDIDTSIDQVDFLPRDSPAWMDSVPEPFRPGDYTLRENALFLRETFAQSRDGATAVFLIRGPVTSAETLDRVAAGRTALLQTSTALTLSDGDLRVVGPLETIRQVASENETVAGLLDAADTDGDGVPEEDLHRLYDAVAAADPDAAAAVFHRVDGEYRALRLSVALVGGSDSALVTSEMREVATTMAGDSPLRVIATGTPIVDELTQRSLLETLVYGFLLTFGLIVVFLTLIFYARYRSLSLGAVVIAPVVLAQAWLFGTMYLAGLSFNTETAIIASIGIGLGVDYAIHIGDRFVGERARGADITAALDETLQGTGGALLASALSTAGGFGVLQLALVPSLQRFGFVTATAIGYAFIASVVVLPSALVLWERYVGLPHHEATD